MTSPVNLNTSLHFLPIKINNKYNTNIQKTTEKFKEISSKDVSKYQNSIKVICEIRDSQDKHVVSDNMPCLCQYFVTELGLRVKASLDVKDNDGNGYSEKEGEVITGEVNASELAHCKAEIHKLQKDLSSYRISGENMEVLMKKMIEEQHFLVTQIFELKKTNEDMRLQQVADRNNQALERSALLRELHEIKLHFRERSNFVEKMIQQNEALTNALKDANGKIYAMGIKYLKLRGYRRSSSNASLKSHNKDEETKSNVSDESYVS